ncbi:hypothetical protein KP509_38G014100 [Ceratopteris richardii]|uniref:G domain-containing protein n=1 Tax=Ceratopteris richardii TaxID=49495 RepID=A0A8T2Q2D8_CERRI|nr:hypothetical protein KP509_38G014100 [Ceratopteris richardii]
MGNAPIQRRTDEPHQGGGRSGSRSGSSSSTTRCTQRQRSGSSSSSTRCTQRQGGHLAPRNQLDDVCERMIAQNEQMKEQFRKAFQAVRILVVGKSGSGKSTLIRMLLGDKGPRSISHGDVGNQDIVKEWRHTDPALPLVIYDSNGIDSAGNERIAEIKEFLDARLATGVEFAERVHAVWYLFNAVDNRAVNDGGLLELVDGYGSKELPLLLIMTHNDVAEKLEDRIDGEILELLLAKIKGEGRRKTLSETMVKVGNMIKFDRDTGEIVKQGSTRDLKGLKMVFERSKQLMDKEVWITWVACQAVDMNAKLEASANFIVRFLKDWILVKLATALPLAAVFGAITYGLSKIWNVDQEFEEAIVKQFLLQERRSETWYAVRYLADSTLEALTLASTLGGIAVTEMMATTPFAAVSAWCQARSTSTLLIPYALMVMGSILYVKMHQEMTADDGKLTVGDYLKLFEKFLVSNWAEKVSRFSEGYASMTSVWEKADRQRLRSEIVNFFRELSLQEIDQQPL